MRPIVQAESLATTLRRLRSAGQPDAQGIGDRRATITLIAFSQDSRPREAGVEGRIEPFRSDGRLWRPSFRGDVGKASVTVLCRDAFANITPAEDLIGLRFGG
jgi:hypothetical protein